MLDAVIALTSVGVGAMLAGTIAFTANQWWIGAVVAVITGVLGAASDRNHAGLQAMIAVGAVSIGVLVWAHAIDAIVIDVVPIVMIGLGVGSGLNRFLFGVIQPVPIARRQRHQSK